MFTKTQLEILHRLFWDREDKEYFVSEALRIFPSAPESVVKMAFSAFLVAADARREDEKHERWEREGRECETCGY